MVLILWILLATAGLHELSYASTPGTLSNRKLLHRSSRFNRTNLISRASSRNELECGLRPAPEVLKLHRSVSHRVAGGYKANEGEFPSFVSIAAFFDGVVWAYCSGTILSNRVVLTAAHCLRSDVQYVVSTSMKNPKQWSYDDQQLEISHFCISPDHDKINKDDGYGYDFGVVVLRESIQFNDYIQPACLTDTKLKKGQPVIAAGIGILQDDAATGEEVEAKELNAIPLEHVPCDYDRQYQSFSCFKAFHPQYMGDTCRGDSGGPIYSTGNGKQTLVAMTSGGPPICQPGVAGVSWSTDLFKVRRQLKDLIRVCTADNYN